MTPSLINSTVPSSEGSSEKYISEYVFQALIEMEGKKHSYSWEFDVN